jgi:hypothetical protein
MIKAFFFSKKLKEVQYVDTPFETVIPIPKREVYIDWRWQEYNIVKSVGKKDRIERGKILSGVSRNNWKFLGIADDKLDIREYVGSSKDGLSATKRVFDSSMNKRLVLDYMKANEFASNHKLRGYSPTEIGKHFGRGGKGSEASWAVKILKKLVRDGLVNKHTLPGHRSSYYVENY